MILFYHIILRMKFFIVGFYIWTVSKFLVFICCVWALIIFILIYFWFSILFMIFVLLAQVTFYGLFPLPAIWLIKVVTRLIFLERFHFYVMARRKWLILLFLSLLPFLESFFFLILLMIFPIALIHKKLLPSFISLPFLKHFFLI